MTEFNVIMTQIGLKRICILMGFTVIVMTWCQAKTTFSNKFSSMVILKKKQVLQFTKYNVKGCKKYKIITPINKKKY